MWQLGACGKDVRRGLVVLPWLDFFLDNKHWITRLVWLVGFLRESFLSESIALTVFGTHSVDHAGLELTDIPLPLHHHHPDEEYIFKIIAG